ncbi:protein YIPF2 [Protopterus annectens]|uniref:protein YIPF2 n=1 Tax=Protopterus annectens TaxID=7888 RepID=UPI001CFBE1F0|nr:protein YIPF2 [Protopterus annectens]
MASADDLKFQEFDEAADLLALHPDATTQSINEGGKDANLTIESEDESDLTRQPSDETELLGTEKKQPSFWTFEYYQSFFDVDTNQVLSRIRASFIPLPGRNFVRHSLRSNPDLYGPFWICATLVFALAISCDVSNVISSYLDDNIHYSSQFRKVQDNILEGGEIRIGPDAKTYLDENSDDIRGTTVEQIKKPKQFYSAVLLKMKKHFPAKDPLLQNMASLLDPAMKLQLSSNVIADIGTHLGFCSSRVERCKLIDEFSVYQMTDWSYGCDKSNFVKYRSMLLGSLPVQDLPTFQKLMRSVHCLPHSNSEAERAFSMVLKRSVIMCSGIAVLITFVFFLKMVCIVPLQAVQWVVILVATMLSGILLALTFWPAVCDDTKAAAITTLIVIVLLHALLPVLSKFYFFSVPGGSDKHQGSMKAQQLNSTLKNTSVAH